MKIIAFNGSPRKDGNTSILIKTVFDELQQQGIETEEIHVGARQTQGCLACMKCWEKKDGRCVITKDSVNDWLAKMRDADGIILASPVYCTDVTGQMKSFMDRTSLVSCANGMLKRKIGASVVAVRRAGALTTFNTLNSFFTINQMIVVGSSYWNMGFGREKGEVLQDEEGLRTMKNLGANMAWLLKSLETATKAS